MVVLTMPFEVLHLRKATLIAVTALHTRTRWKCNHRIVGSTVLAPTCPRWKRRGCFQEAEAAMFVQTLRRHQKSEECL